MLVTEVYQDARSVDTGELIWQLAPAAEDEDGRALAALLADLGLDRPWGTRQSAARKLGYMGCRAAVPDLVEALPGDSFWMVRCAIIQALEKIGDARALPTLRQVAASDRFQVVRSHAAKAVATIDASYEHRATSD
ncbi:MAG TPA: HEAT repeat domain-containing protein [Anaerolineae bacterium]|nr:HEAT repeat domain-containing protein [Anaerolineae bacterium]